MNHKKLFLVAVIFLTSLVSLHSQVLQWQGYWAGAYTSGTPSSPWLVMQQTSAYSFQIIDTNYQTVTTFSLPIPGGALYYNIIAASPDFDTDGNIEVLYQYTDSVNYTGHIFLRDISTSSNQLTFSDTDTTYYAYTFYFGNERTIIIAGSFNNGTHTYLYRSNNPQSIGNSGNDTKNFQPFMNLYPNPALHFSEIHFAVPENSNVELTIYNHSGRKVKTLKNAFMKKGEYTIPWYGTDSNNKILPSGSYFFRIDINGKMVSKKMIMLK